MQKRKLFLAAGLVVILLLNGSTATWGAESGSASGTVGGGRDADGVAMDVSIGWNNTSNLSCFVLGPVLLIFYTPAGPGEPACSVEFDVFLPNGETLSAFNYQLDVVVDNEFCVVRWSTSQEGDVPQAGVAVPEGPREWRVLIGGAAAVPSAIPALGEWGMIILGIGVVLAAMWMIRRRGVLQDQA